MLNEDRVYTSAVLNKHARAIMGGCSESAQLMACLVDEWGNEEFMPVHAVGQLVDDESGCTGAIVFYHVEGRESPAPKGGDDE